MRKTETTFAAGEPLEHGVQKVLAWLNSHSSKDTLAGMSRFAIPSTSALGVGMKDMKSLGKQIGRDQELAVALWETGIYESRILASLVGDPKRLSGAQMDRWCKEFDSWAVCDAMCYNLFRRTPHAWEKVAKWSGSKEEFVKRAAFALIWSLSVHDKAAADEPFLEGLSLIERAAVDERNFVKKAVNMALRATGKRNKALHTRALAVARQLSGSADATARWVGKDALKELTSTSVLQRLEQRSMQALGS